MTIRGMFLAGMALAFAGGIWASAPPVLPTLGPPVELKLPGRPAAVADVKTDDEGRLYLTDIDGGRVFVYSPEGRFLRTIGAPGAGPGRMTRPIDLSICGDTLAVREDHGSIHLFSVTTGRYLSTLRLPASNFCTQWFLTPKRIVFPGESFPVMPVPGRPVELWLLYSTSWEGLEPRINDARSYAPGQFDVSREAQWAAALATPWGRGRWAVTHSLPRKIFLLDDEGRTLAVSQAEPADVSRLPNTTFDTMEATQKAIVASRYVCGLVPAGRWLGVVWEHRLDRVPLEVEWMNQRLETVGREPLHLSFPLALFDALRIAATDRFGRVYLIVHHIDPTRLAYTTSLYVLHLTLPGRRP